MAQKAPSGTQAIQRAAAVLQGVGAAGTRGIRMADLLLRLAIERPTLHRVLMCLVAEGLVCRDPVSKRFFLGRTLYDLGRTIAPRYSIRDICATALTRIAAKTGDTVFLVALDGTDGVVMDRRDGAATARSMPLTVGMRRPLGVGASGVAMLMTLADDDARRFVGDNAPLLSLHDVASGKLLNSLPKFRQRGYAISRGYGRPGLCGIGVPLCGPGNRPFGAVSVTGVSPRMTTDHRRDVLAILRSELAPLGNRLLAAQA
jgi:DNA-binding IclR family transcriptional regulator